MDPLYIVLCGLPGAGKSSYAARTYPTSWVVSTDWCRWRLADDESAHDDRLNRHVYTLFHGMIDARLSLGRSVVADSTALSSYRRRELVEIGRYHGIAPRLIILDVPATRAQRQDAQRARVVGADVIAGYAGAIERVKARARDEGFASVTILCPHESAA